jgi:Dyp-type peroxidase family
MDADPVLDPGEIQGDALAGFRKDHVRFIFVAFPLDKMTAAKNWLGSLVDRIGYLNAVHAFNTAFSRMREQLATDPPLSACWLAIGFTYEGLRLLRPDWDFRALDESFKSGSADSAGVLGDPTDGSPGDPATWEVGRPGQPLHAMLTFAADHEKDVNAAADQMVSDIGQLGFTLVLDQRGDTLKNMPGHEHFGFKDGISQPGVRGRIGPHGPFVTRRVLAATDPLAGSFSAPGEPLLWPGEFVLGYPRKKTGSIKPDDLTTDSIPAWMKNGSYAVFRKIYQDVPGFLNAIKQETARLRTIAGFGTFDEEQVGACAVGRWRSGAPLMRAPQADNPQLAKDADASNSFFFGRDTPAATYEPATNHDPDPPQLARRDPDGKVCPLSSHIRKVNPRDDITDQGNAVRTLERRIIRRGVPFGPDYDPVLPESADKPRGLLFVCYQRSIKGGFEFLQHNWANAADAPHDGAGADLIIGQTGGGLREMLVKTPDGASAKLAIANFTHAGGMVYLFTPSRQTLIELAQAAVA